MSLKDFHNVRVKVNTIGRGELFIDDKKIHGVRSIKFSAGVDELTEVKLVLAINSLDVDATECEVSHIGSEYRAWIKPAA